MILVLIPDISTQETNQEYVRIVDELYENVQKLYQRSVGEWAIMRFLEFKWSAIITDGSDKCLDFYVGVSWDLSNPSGDCLGFISGEIFTPETSCDKTEESLDFHV